MTLSKVLICLPQCLSSRGMITARTLRLVRVCEVRGQWLAEQRCRSVHPREPWLPPSPSRLSSLPLGNL